MIVSDFDGTLSYGEDNAISKANINAINNFINDGGIFAVCTGRSTQGISHVLNGINFKGVFASFNGAVITDNKTGKTLYSNVIPNKTCLKFLKYVKQNNINGHTYPDGFLTVEDYNDFTKWYLIYNKTPVKIVPSLYDYYEKGGYDSCKLLVFDKKETIDNCLSELQNLLPECSVIRGDVDKIEITAKGETKGAAVKNLSKLYNVPVSEIIAIGDAGNDVPMLQTAGLGVAMGNAADDIKRYAKAIAPSVENDAIAYVINTYCK